MNEGELAIGLLAAILPVTYASVLWHEAGHAVMGRMAGFVVTSFGAGTARPFCVVRLGTTRAYLCLIRPVQGLTFAFMPRLIPGTGPFVCFLAGGILFNAALALLSLVALKWLPRGSVLWLTSAGVNGLLAAFSLVPLPLRIGGATLQTDGASIWQTLRSGSVITPHPVLIQTEAYFRPLWLSTGDHLAARLYRLFAAQAWACLDDPERAEAAFGEAQALPGPEPSWASALGELVRFQIELARGRPDAAAEALDAAEAAFHDDGNDVGLVMVRLNREVLRLAGGDAGGAAAALDDLTSHPLVVRHRRLAESLLVARLSARAAMSDVPVVNELLAEYRSWRPGEDLVVNGIVARLHARREDWASAEPAYRRSLAAIHALAALWTDPAERARFLDRRAAYFDEARHCFAKVGHGDENVGPAEFPSVAELQRERNTRLRRSGLRLMLLNLAVVLGSVAIFWIAPLGYGRYFAPAILSLGLFTVVGALYLAFDLTLGRVIPLFRTSGGAVILILAGMGWIPTATVLLLMLLDG